MTLAEIIADLEDQLNWRGPGGQPQGHVVIPRSEAQELLTEIRGLQRKSDVNLQNMTAQDMTADDRTAHFVGRTVLNIIDEVVERAGDSRAMNVQEFIADINRQLDLAPDSTVTFSRDDAYSLLSRLTLLKNLIDKGEDKTPAQIASLMVQRADAAERKTDRLIEALKLISDPLNLNVESNETGTARAMRIILTIQQIAKTALKEVAPEAPLPEQPDQSTALGG